MAAENPGLRLSALLPRDRIGVDPRLVVATVALLSVPALRWLWGGRTRRGGGCRSPPVAEPRMPRCWEADPVASHPRHLQLGRAGGPAPRPAEDSDELLRSISSWDLPSRWAWGGFSHATPALDDRSPSASATRSESTLSVILECSDAERSVTRWRDSHRGHSTTGSWLTRGTALRARSREPPKTEPCNESKPPGTNPDECPSCRSRSREALPGLFQKDFLVTPPARAVVDVVPRLSAPAAILLCALTGSPSTSPTTRISGKTRSPDLAGSTFDLHFFDWPSSPAWLYAFTQGLHIISQASPRPLILLGELRSAMPKFFEWPPACAHSHTCSTAYRLHFWSAHPFVLLASSTSSSGTRLDTLLSRRITTLRRPGCPRPSSRGEDPGRAAGLPRAGGRDPSRCVMT